MNNYSIVPACLPYTQDALEQFIVTWQGVAQYIHIDCVRNMGSDIPDTITPQQIIEILSPYEFSFKHIEVHIMGNEVTNKEQALIHAEFYNAVIFSKKPTEIIRPEISFPFTEYVSESYFDVNCMMIEHVGRQGEPFKNEYVSDLIEFSKQTSAPHICIDGGLTDANITELKTQFETNGVSEKHVFFIVGSYLNGDDAVEKYHKLTESIK